MSTSRVERFLQYLLPSLEDVLFIAIFFSVIALGPRLMNIDGDLGRHLTLGEYMLQESVIPTQDVFSHTMAGESLTPHEWLVQVVFAVFYRLAALDGVVFVCALLIALTFLGVYRQSLKLSGGVLLSLGFSLAAAAASSLHWLARPHLVTILFVVLWAGQLERLRQGQGGRWWNLSLLMLFWVNLHGAFIAGFMLLGMYVAGELLEKGWGSWQRWKPWLLGGTASLAASLLNPAGWHIWATSVGYVRNSYLVGHTAEYLPPNFHSLSTWPFLGLIALSLLLLGLRRSRVPLAHLFLVAGWTAMGLYSTRNIPLYAVLSAPILAALARDVIQEREFTWFQNLQARISSVDADLRRGYWMVLVVLGVALTFYIGHHPDLHKGAMSSSRNQFSSTTFPVQAAAWVEKYPPEGEMFNYFPWGGYLLYRLWPAQNVFIDGQTDFYGETLTRQYERVITLGDGWEDVLEQYGVDWVIMPVDSALSDALRAELTWEVAYEDATAIIFVR